MPNYKKLTFYLGGVLAAVLVFHLLIWHLWTGKVIGLEGDSGIQPGDLARVGYLYRYAELKKWEVNLPETHVEAHASGLAAFQVVTLGDSFSNAHMGGLNPYYQDYITSIHGVRVLNLPAYKKTNSLETALILANSGYLEKRKVKYLVLQRVEKNCTRVFSPARDFSMSDDLKQVEAYYKEKKPRASALKAGFLNAANIKFIVYAFLYRISDNAFFSQAYVRKLDRRLFTHREGDRVLFHSRDWDENTPENIEKMNKNLNALAAVLRKKGIELYFMPVPNKYTVYQRFIPDNPYPLSVFFERLRRLPRDYRWVDLKAVFDKAHDSGEKDLYYFDDTHWQPKASEMAARAMNFGGT